MSTDGSIIRRYRENGTNFYAHIFTNSAGSATLTLSGFSGSTNVDYLVVAGGGGGGGSSWSGGGGGVRFGRTNMTAGTTYSVVVGVGGLGYGVSGTIGSNGSPSSISGSDVTVTTTGGGLGSRINVAGAQTGGSGGGGAGGVGQNASANVVRDGGPGRVSTLRDGVTAAAYAAGGSGRARPRDVPVVDGQSQADNTGDGGDGGSSSNGSAKGGTGGSGIVIVRYVTGGK